MPAADRRGRPWPAPLACFLFATGLALAWEPAPPPAPAPAPLAASLSPPGPVAASPAGPPAGLPRSVPVRLDIPAVGIHTPLSRLGLHADGTIALPPPTRTAPAGWYQHLATPGEIGTAVLVGHVDSARSGPAVFYRLRELRPGDPVAVRRADGTTARFRVVTTKRYAKSRFPAEQVYGAADHAALRLITCGGAFDRRRGHYRDVVVVFATGSPGAVRPVE